MTRQSGEELIELTAAELDMVSGGALRRSIDLATKNFGAINPEVLHAAEQQLQIAGRYRIRTGLGSLPL